MSETAHAESLEGVVVDGRYRILEKLGEGGMGAVYEAEQIALARRVALKVVHPRFAGDGEIRSRFTREATASGQLDGHPHVATALDFGTLEDGSLYLVMQLVKGPSLRDVVDHAPLKWERAVTLASQVADALSAAHAKGIVHRDLKPDNVALVRREDGREIAKVLDFGIARMVEGADTPAATQTTQLTRVGTVMGTPGYMAPEQAVGDQVDARADLYALGAMIFEMVTGILPFDGPDYSSILALQFAEPPRRPIDVRPESGHPSELDDLVVELLSRSPNDRPASAADVRTRLEAMIRNSTLPRDPTPMGVPAQASKTLQGAKKDPREQLMALIAAFRAALPPRARPHAVPLLAGVVGLPLLLLVVGLLRGDDPPPPVAPTPAIAVERAPEPSAPALPPELEQAFSTLVASENAEARAAAARTILAARETPGLPAVAAPLAELEGARSCRTRTTALEALEATRDARALPAVRRLAQTPRTGCGVFRNKDCLACVRGDIDRVVATLGGAR